ncbi:MAG: MBL fold metallo-hydrolase [Candidatus Lokiarchaeota archaeon]|nr:MBL fold metallo-hydrolase [Candidatus Lokiarchaeota archaeon]
MTMDIYWLGHAAFKIKTPSGRILYLDPYQIKKGAEKADIIVSTHSHSDHFDSGSIQNLMRDDTVVIGPESIASSLQKFDGTPLKLGDSFDYKDLSIELVPAYNIKKPNHPKHNEWAGIIITTEDKSVYHAGDTERIPEMKDLASRNITVAMMPCGGTYTMDFDEATDSIIDVKPKIAIPMHNWGKNLTKFKELIEKKDPSIKVEILEEGGNPLKI